MHFTTVTFLALLSTALALPKPDAPVTHDTYTWDITNFEIGCSPAACTYAFNISSIGDQYPLPSFATYCSGTDVQSGEATCADNQIRAEVQPQPPSLNGSSWEVYVSRLYSEGDGSIQIYAGNVTIPTVDDVPLTWAQLRATYQGELN